MIGRALDPLTVQAITDEADRAEGRYGPFHSSHEAFGVLWEEVAELFDAVRENDLLKMEREAVQVAAVAARIALCARGSEEFASRSRKR
jgi:NTP pyrophosphatase (non-canonical NTP hydrolase)